MTILYYIPNISKDHGGIFQYSLRVLKDVVKTDNKIIILNNSDPSFYQNKFQIFSNVKVISNENQSVAKKVIAKCQRISRLLSGELKFFKKYPEQTLSIGLLKKHKIDLVHSPTQGYPLGKTPFIFTLHDVQELHMPEYFTPLEREKRARNNRIGCEKAARIVVSYSHVQKDLIKYFNLSQDKIDVVFIGTTDDKLTQRANTLDIQTKYILYPAATWPHKNHASLLKAFKTAITSTKEMKDYKLICTGYKTHHFKSIEKLMNDIKICEQVEFKGVVTDEELKDLYANCRAVVVPTKYEAGSFPLMESIVQAIPVICSNVTSLPETIVNPLFCFDPDNTEEMADKIIQICENQKYREQNVTNSIRLRQKMVNRDLATEFSNIYAKIN